METRAPVASEELQLLHLQKPKFLIHMQNKIGKWIKNTEWKTHIIYLKQNT